MTSNSALSDQRSNTLVIGIGNPLCSDDGLGVHVASLLCERELPPGVQIAELGTPGWGLVNHLADGQRVILIDAVEMGLEPGTWRRLAADDIGLIAGDSSVSLHEPGLAESLALAQALDLLPEEFVLYGVEPACTDPGLALSPEVGEAIPVLMENILGEIWKTT